MTNLDRRKKPALQDWHVADIKAQLEKKGWSLSKLSHKNGYCRSAAAVALRAPWPKMEQLIAQTLGVAPQAIWPSRYDDDGRSNRKMGRAGVSNMPRAPGARNVQSQGSE